MSIIKKMNCDAPGCKNLKDLISSTPNSTPNNTDLWYTVSCPKEDDIHICSIGCLISWARNTNALFNALFKEEDFKGGDFKEEDFDQKIYNHTISFLQDNSPELVSKYIDEYLKIK